MAPKEHIEEIRKGKFSIGAKEPNLLTEDLHQAVKNLSAELYAKDVHFLMEIIQNAEDNEYPDGVKPSLEFVMTTTDITATGAPATLLVCNNEKGFSSKNIDSICSVGRSTKKGHRERGYIGEKGIGFKSVFLITSRPYIFSNGYQIMFSEDPCPECNVGYIVPQWVEEHPTVAELQQVYGSARSLPTTIIVLPLKPDKVHPVKQQLSSIHPEVLLFLAKIKRLSVREANKDPKLNTLCEVSISSETEFVSRKNVDAESYTLHLSAEEISTSSEAECSYYMWRQRFPVKLGNKVERRMEVEEWVITLALPIGQRLNRGMSLPGIYAFLPTEMVTNFPFIIQADFVLASSRETILLDNKWNQGILDCVPSAFISAFVSLIKSSVAAPVSTLANMFTFIPINPSSYPKLNTVRDAIKLKLMEENILPSQTNSTQKFFYKPGEVGRLLPAFWNILEKAEKQGVSLQNLSTHGKYVLNSAFDKSMYDNVLNFLEVKAMENEWYAKCIRGSNLVTGVSENLYIEILLFLFDNWGTHFQNTAIKNIRLLKYIGEDGVVYLLSIADAMSKQGKKICLSKDSHHVSWLIDWNNEFRCSLNYHFIPKSTQEALQSFPRRETIRTWLISLGVRVFNVFEYADLLCSSIHSSGSKLVITSAHFLCHSLRGNYLSKAEVNMLCKKLPLVDKYGSITTQRSGVLVPARDSNWFALMGTNPWRGNRYVELTEDYLKSGNFAGSHTKEKQLMAFLKEHVGASDIPHTCPPDDSLPTVESPLTIANTFLLLDWIRSLRSQRKLVDLGNFLRSIRNGCWLQTCLGDSTSYSYPPSKSFLLTTSHGSLLQNGSELVDIPMVDIHFYGSRINEYKEELKAIGVIFEFGEACKYMGKRLMHLAASSNLKKSNVFSILKFVRLLRQKYLPLDDFVKAIQKDSWLKTLKGDMSPVDSILFDSEWKVAAQISSLPVIDNEYYGKDISGFKAELKLLGVKVEFQKDYQIVVNSFKMPPSLTVEATFLILECVRHTNSSTFLRVLKEQKWLKAGVLKSPSECFLFDGEWGCILKVFSGFPSITEQHYGPDIVSYKNELKKLGVVVDFDEAAKVFAGQFKQHASSSSITKDNVLCFLSCCRQLKKAARRLPMEVNKCLREEKWLQTRLGRRVPKESILFHSDWEILSSVVSLPFIDDSDSGYGRGILEYRDELKAIGVVTEFSSGMQFVVSGLNIPTNPSDIAPASALSLMNCIKMLLKENNALPEEFLKRVNRRWLKTHMGYRDPGSCLLFDAKWNSLLQPEDGPFIDDAFYCSKTAFYSKELEAIGVTVDNQHGCSLIASHLESHSQFTVISRIYRCMCHFHWEPKNGAPKERVNEASGQIFIPNGSNTGQWVCPEDCVIYDKDGLFGFQLNVLEKHYEKDLLNYFCSAFGVRRYPNADDYCKLWNGWESKKEKLTTAECWAFWLYIARHWNSKTEKLLSEKLLKLPVSSKDSGDILLFDKNAILIPDDLQLQDCLEKASPDPLFVWYPKPSFPSVTKSKLNEIFASIGVPTISESVKKEGTSLLDTAELKQITAKGSFIKRGLIRIILAFLADPSLEIDFEKRRQMVTYLLDLLVFETEEPITASYGLKLSTGSTLKVEVSQMIRWERENMKLFTQKVNRSTSGHKENIAYATYFSKVIAEGLMWEKADQIAGLCELIKLGWLLDFEEDAINFLLKSKNLQLCYEDEEFIKSAFALD
ncbi:uncharacterized protein LOC113359161 [Papaver somniferum]|uniref:uncharacterized protein LOC113359161 n=1 Tax=Papaver somniferum TaxID=3469 RepID=UPI000E704796|nr:uncharacterized protein LOC113359161 [Papaver somniferum]